MKERKMSIENNGRTENYLIVDGAGYILSDSIKLPIEQIEEKCKEILLEGDEEAVFVYKLVPFRKVTISPMFEEF